MTSVWMGRQISMRACICFSASSPAACHAALSARWNEGSAKRSTSSSCMSLACCLVSTTFGRLFLCASAGVGGGASTLGGGRREGSWKVGASSEVHWFHVLAARQSCGAAAGLGAASPWTQALSYSSEMRFATSFQPVPRPRSASSASVSKGRPGSETQWVCSALLPPRATLKDVSGGGLIGPRFGRRPRTRQSFSGIAKTQARRPGWKQERTASSVMPDQSAMVLLQSSNLWTFPKRARSSITTSPASPV
mmetsp:Transcript_14053/g.40104  ORF Transcript_14053/g.40104 Transcript_14053/m.40104 type:complete len:251 (-) Transcript_14053:516-1268(-)